MKERQPKSISSKNGEESNAVLVNLNGKNVRLTHLDKFYWPDEKITKRDLIYYYYSIRKFILPHLKDRPQSLKRNPSGIGHSGFFHKDAGDEAPSWVKSVSIHSESSRRDVDYIICNNEATLAYLNNLGCIELNPWLSRTNKLDRPDYMVIDIDPPANHSFNKVVDVTLALKEVLDSIGAVSFCKTSGASGMHVYVPLGARYTYNEVRPFAQAVALMTHDAVPGLTTVERSLKKRQGKIYLDYLQNSQGQTLACVYSVRPVLNACVSTPLSWKEVKAGLDPRDFTLANIKKRIVKRGDIFHEVLTGKNDLRKCQKKLESLVLITANLI